MILLALMNIIVFNTIVCLLYIGLAKDRDQFEVLRYSDWSDRQFEQGG